MTLETTYPKIPGLPYQITADSGLAQYIGYFFGLAIVAAGILAVVVLAIGGIRMIMSGGNPTGRKEAIDIIKGSVLGLALVMASFMILRTINPVFITPTQTPLPSVEGIYYTNGSDRQAAPMAEADTRNAPEGYDQILYDCSSGPSLFVWKFPETNFEGIESAFVETVDCGKTTSISGLGSFKIAFKTFGIYYFLGEGCSGYMSGANTAGGQISEPFKNNIKSIKIINNTSGDIRYGAIFHASDDPASSGVCSDPYFTLDPALEERCFEIKTATASSTFFVWNAASPETSGTGVDFYSEPWGDRLGARAGKYSLTKNIIKTFWFGSAQNLNFTSYSGTRPPEYKPMYPNFYQKPGSIAINGNYLVAFYSNSQNCKIFFSDTPNLKEIDFFATGNWVDNIDVIPIK